MIFVNRILVWVSAAAVLVALELLLHTTELYQLLLVVGVLNAVVILSLWQMTGRQVHKAAFWNFFITPIMAVNSGWSLLIFLESPSTQQLVAFVTTAAVWIFLKVTFLYFSFRPKYEAHSLENISSYLNLITIFLFSSNAFNVIVLLRVPVWQAALGCVLLFGLLSYQLFWISDITFRASWRSVLAITLVGAEFFLALSYLPTSVYVNGLMITLGYYAMTGLARNWLLNIREGRVVLRYLLISFSILAILLLTAKWV